MILHFSERMLGSYVFLCFYVSVCERIVWVAS